MIELVNEFFLMCTLLVIIDKWSLNMYAKDFCPLGASRSFLYFPYNLEIVFN